MSTSTQKRGASPTGSLLLGIIFYALGTITDAVLQEVTEWQNRPLDAVYPVVFFDALRVKIRDEGLVKNKAVYIALGVTREGEREVLGLWIADNEGAKFWLKVFNDLKTGATERAKHHWRNMKMPTHYSNVYVVEAAVKDKPVLAEAFFKELSTPPKDKIFKASDLLEKERANGMGKNVTIMHLVEGAERGRWSNNRPMVWHDAGKADSFDAKETHYYLPLSGYQCLGIVKDVKDLHYHLNKSGIFTGTIYGVRKSDIEWVKTQKNWVNLDEHIKGKLSKLGQADVLGLVKKAIDFKNVFRHNAAMYVSNKNSPYLKLYNTFATVKDENETLRSAQAELCKLFGVKIGQTIDLTKLIKQYETEVRELKSRYSLLDSLRDYTVDNTALGEYINIVDATKGV